MQAQQKFYTKLYYPILLRKLKFHICFFRCDLLQGRALCCLAFHLLLCSVFKVQAEGYTLKIEQCKNGLPATLKAASGFRRAATSRKGLTWELRGTCDPASSP